MFMFDAFKLRVWAMAMLSFLKLTIDKKKSHPSLQYALYAGWDDETKIHCYFWYDTSKFKLIIIINISGWSRDEKRGIVRFCGSLCFRGSQRFGPDIPWLVGQKRTGSDKIKPDQTRSDRIRIGQKWTGSNMFAKFGPP